MRRKLSRGDSSTAEQQKSAIIQAMLAHHSNASQFAFPWRPKKKSIDVQASFEYVKCSACSMQHVLGCDWSKFHKFILSLTQENCSHSIDWRDGRDLEWARVTHRQVFIAVLMQKIRQLDFKNVCYYYREVRAVSKQQLQNRKSKI
jgi:hypothetical protein